VWWANDFSLNNGVNGQFRSCQLWSFITVHAQNQSNGLGLYCQVTSWPSKYKKSLLPVCDKPYHKIKENRPNWEELEKLWNYALTNTYFSTMFKQKQNWLAQLFIFLQTKFRIEYKLESLFRLVCHWLSAWKFVNQITDSFIRAVPGKKVLGGEVEQNLKMVVPPTKFYILWYNPYG